MTYHDVLLNYDEDAAIRAAVEESLAMQNVPPRYRDQYSNADIDFDDLEAKTPIEMKVAAILSNANRCRAKISKLITLDTQNTKQLPSSPKKSPQHSLNSTAEIRRQQDIEYERALNEILQANSDSSSIHSDFSNEQISYSDEDDNAQNTQHEEEDEEDGAEENVQMLKVAITLSNGSKVMNSFPSNQKGEIVYTWAAEEEAKTSHGTLSFDLVGPTGEKLLKNRKLSSQNIPNRTNFRLMPS